MQGPALHHQLLRLQCHACGQKSGGDHVVSGSGDRACGAVGPTIGRQGTSASPSGLPFVQRKNLERHIRHHAAVGQGRRLHAVQANAQAALHHPRLIAAPIADVGGRQQASQTQLNLFTQGFGATATACATGDQARVHAQRQLVSRGFGQGRGQIQAQALQLAGDAQLGVAVAKANHRVVGGAATHALREGIERRQFHRLLQTLCRGRALHAQRDGRLCFACARRLRAAVHAQVAAQHAGQAGGDGESRLVETHGALRLFQLGQFAHDAQVVAAQDHLALEFGFFQVGQGQAELDACGHIARGRAVMQAAAEHRVQRGFLHQAQQLVGQGAAGFG